MSDSLLAEYEARRLATQINLRRYYNECVAIMSLEEAGDIHMEDALAKFLDLDARYAKDIVDDIAPRKNVLEL